ncbi:MAG: LUD domain-containing protein [Caldilineaceae bacterium]|nr:LUD domain-containing protein [Caldilineaceae bacterium]
MTTRDELLDKLRTNLARPDLRFPPPTVTPLTPTTRMTVTSAEGGPYLLAQRFGSELTRLHGTYQLVESVAEARMALFNQLLAWKSAEEQAQKGQRRVTNQERSILSWQPDMLPVPGVDEALKDMGFQLVVPTDLSSAESREAVRFIRFGLTGVEAAFASTGSMVMASSPATNRVASLLPFRHLALIPLDRLYPTPESWLQEQRAAGTLVDFFRQHANLAMISGPSKSADIEMNLTLGVHGPKFVHAILFAQSGELA